MSKPTFIKKFVLPFFFISSLFAIPDGYYAEGGFNFLKPVINDTSNLSSSYSDNHFPANRAGFSLGGGMARTINRFVFWEVITKVWLVPPQNDTSWLKMIFQDAAGGLGACYEIPFMPLNIYGEMRLAPFLFFGALANDDFVYPNTLSLVIGQEILISANRGVRITWEFGLGPAVAAMMGKNSYRDNSLRIAFIKY